MTINVKMELLPNEIIEHILMDPSLSIFDVVNFSSTCSKFREIVISNRGLWRVKYFQRWPKVEIDIVCEDWRNEYISRALFEKQILDLLSTMSSKFFHLDMKNIGDIHLNFIIPLINSQRYGYYYLKDFLIEINSKPLAQSLTDKYYGGILLKYMHKRHCREVWNNFLKLSVEEQTLEKGAIFVTFWCQEYERGIWDTITSELDNIASSVRHHLLQNYKNHPIRNISEETLLTWKNKNLSGNMFEPEHCKSIIWAINYVLFVVLKFCIAYDFVDLDCKRTGIDFALIDKKANPIVFAVIYESIARRLGVKIEVLEFLNHCLLRWKENYSEEESATHYVNSSAESIFVKSRCPRRLEGYNSNTVIIPCSMVQMAQRAAFHIYPRENHGESHVLVRDALELMLTIKPLNLECYNLLSRSYMLHEIDARELILKLKEAKSQLLDSEWRLFQPLLQSLELYQETWERHLSPNHSQTPTVRSRVEDIDFAVGMIVRAKLCGRTGVIHGWSLVAPTTNQRMSRRVIYKVLVDDGSYQYISQENLQILHSPPLIFHPSIGRFFDKYCTTFYRPNKELQAEYPQDMEALQKILKKDRQT